MTSPGWTLRGVQDAYVNAVKGFLSPHEATREATLVIAHLTGLTRTQQVVRGGDGFEGDIAAFNAIIAARTARQPLAQILGNAPFRDRLFRVTQDVLCPRADTETLIDLALAVRPRKILDLGTGPGTIVLTLLAELPDATATATDISPAALGVAAENAARFGLSRRLTLTRSDWLRDVTEVFDLIVSNPPYVSAQAYAALEPEITQWEPEIALTPGGDGLEPYRIIARDAGGSLAQGGHLMVEIGFDQGQAVAELFRAAGLDNVRVHSDLSGKDRVVCATKP